MANRHGERPLFVRPIMCAVDASDEAECVIWAGARLAALTGAPLVLFHVARSPGRWHGVDRLLHPDRQASSSAEGRRLLQERAADVPVAATVELSSGAPAAEVLNAADDLDPALLVMGSGGRGILHTLLGSVSQDVSTFTTRPALIVPEGGDEELLGGPVFCGLDDSETSVRAASVAAELAGSMGAELVLHSVLDVTGVAAAAAAAAIPALPEPPDVTHEREDTVRERAERVAERLRGSASVRVLVDTGDPATRLGLAAREFAACLIAVGNSHRSAVAAALTRSVPAALIASGERPVLLVAQAGRWPSE